MVVTRVIEDANDTMDVNIGTGEPLFKRVVGEGSRAAKRRVKSSKEMEDEDVDGPGSNALWLPEDFSASCLSVEIDEP